MVKVLEAMMVQLQNETEGIQVSERIHLVPSLMKTNMEYTFNTHARENKWDTLAFWNVSTSRFESTCSLSLIQSVHMLFCVRFINIPIQVYVSTTRLETIFETVDLFITQVCTCSANEVGDLRSSILSQRGKQKVNNLLLLKL